MDYKNVQPLADFDWNAVDEKAGKIKQQETGEKNDAYEKSFNAFTEQEVIEGTIVAITDREVVVNVGAKSDGVIPISEVRYNPDLKAGDKIEVYVESQEDANGQLMLSHKKARILKSWDRVNEAYDNQEIITGYVKSRTKGGLIVTVFENIEAFLPGSQIDVKPIRDYDVYVDKTMEFKVVKINHEYKNVVVSHKALIEDEIEAQKAEIISHLEKGQVLEGVVKNITSYGVFVDLGGVGLGLLKAAARTAADTPEDREALKLFSGLKRLTIVDFSEAAPDVREKFLRKANRILSGGEMLMEAKDGGETVRIYGTASEDGTLLEDIALLAGDALIFIRGSIRTDQVEALMKQADR